MCKILKNKWVVASEKYDPFLETIANSRLQSKRKFSFHYWDWKSETTKTLKLRCIKVNIEFKEL